MIVPAPRSGDVLLAAVRARYQDPSLEVLSSLAAAGPDWGLVGELARLHAVAPLLENAVARLPAGSVPTPAREEIAAAAASARLRSLELTGELLTLLDVFEAAGIEVLPYKGPVLAAAAYGDPAARTFRDLDLLVRPRDLAAALALTRERGYTDRTDLPPRWERHERRHGHDRKLVAGRSVIELQWALAGRAEGVRAPIGQLFERAINVQVGGRGVPSLGPEDLLLVLTAHGSLHLWERLAWVADVAEALRTSPALDTDTMLARAGEWGTRRMTLVGLELARSLLGAQVPEGLGAGPEERAIARDLARACLTRGDGAPAEAPALTHLRGAMRLQDSARQKACLAARHLFVPSVSDFMAVRLPDALFPAYYLVRPIRLAAAYVVGDRRPGDAVQE